MRSITMMAVLFVAACASGGKGNRSCAAVPVEQRAGVADVYRACEVDAVADLIRGGPRPSYTPSPAIRCARVDLELVVDSAGRIVLPSVRVKRSTDQVFTEAIVAVLPSIRYTPARKSGAPVAQLVEYSSAVSTVTVVAPLGGAAPGSGRLPSRPPC